MNSRNNVWSKSSNADARRIRARLPDSHDVQAYKKSYYSSLVFLIRRIHFSYGWLLTPDVRVRDMVETSFVAWMTGRHADTTNFEEVPFKFEDVTI